MKRKTKNDTINQLNKSKPTQGIKMQETDISNEAVENEANETTDQEVEQAALVDTGGDGPKTGHGG